MRRELPALRLKRNEDRRLHAGHLWIFSNEVDTQQTPLSKFKAGELVRVLAHNDRALGLAYVNPQSLISARMLDVEDSRYGLAGGAHPRGAQACASDCTRSPIIVWCTASPTDCRAWWSTAMAPPASCRSAPPAWNGSKPQIQEALSQVLRCEALLFKNDSSAREMEGLPSYVEAAKGRFDESTPVVEDGLEFQAPLAEGQKTGWFFDQAANRRALSKYVRKGARVLDVFSYVGAWGVRAAHSGAGEVICVDSSAAALELAASNAERNARQGQCGI